MFIREVGILSGGRETIMVDIEFRVLGPFGPVTKKFESGWYRTPTRNVYQRMAVINIPTDYAILKAFDVDVRDHKIIFKGYGPISQSVKLKAIGAKWQTHNVVLIHIL